MLCSTNTSLMSHLAQGLHEIPCFPITPQILQRVSGSSLTSPPPICAFPPSEAQALSPAQSWTLQAQQRWQNKSLCNRQWCHCHPWDDKMQFSYTHEILGNALKSIKNWHSLENIYGSQYKAFWKLFQGCSKFYLMIQNPENAMPYSLCYHIMFHPLHGTLFRAFSWVFLSCHGMLQIFGVNSVFFLHMSLKPQYVEMHLAICSALQSWSKWV